MFKIAVLVVVVVIVISGCATMSWYGQAIGGQLDLLSRREHIAHLINDPATDPQLRSRLETVLEIRDFAVAELALPDSGSYQAYADLERDAVVWNVVATPRFSLTPKTWCYPIAGCLSYRGYFNQARANRAVVGLEEQGYDVALGPAVAYSTLGWFADPVLNTMLAWDDAVLAGFIFHELAHEKLFVKGDTAFSEAYARLVEREGVRRWLLDRGDEAALANWEANRKIGQALTEVLLEARQRLIAHYARDLNETEMAVGKAAEFARLRAEIAELAERLGTRRLDRWSQRPLNNAHLAQVATYEDGVDAFGALLDECDGDITCFHGRAAELAAADPASRRDFLRRLRDQ
ncbi:MAG: aminopeptidase [Wenzhouxiangella sp.]